MKIKLSLFLIIFFYIRISDTCFIPFIGAYVGAGDPTGINSLGEFLGRNLTWALDYLANNDWDKIANPIWWLQQWSGWNYRMIWSVPILINASTNLSIGATGQYNQYFKQLAENLVNYNYTNSVIRPGWEMNGDWYIWSAANDPSGYVEYWKQIVITMRSVPGNNFTFVWNPNIGEQSIAPDLIYPGDEYVDFVGVDVYDAQWANYPGPEQSWQILLTENYGLNWLSNFSKIHNKPIIIPEWGLWNNGITTSDPNNEVGGGDDPYYIEQMANWFVENNVVCGSYFDYEDAILQTSLNPNGTIMFQKLFGINSTLINCTSTSTTTSTTNSKTSSSILSTGSTSNNPTGTTSNAIIIYLSINLKYSMLLFFYYYLS